IGDIRRRNAPLRHQADKVSIDRADEHMRINGRTGEESECGTLARDPFFRALQDADVADHVAEGAPKAVDSRNLLLQLEFGTLTPGDEGRIAQASQFPLMLLQLIGKLMESVPELKLTGILGMLLDEGLQDVDARAQNVDGMRERIVTLELQLGHCGKPTRRARIPDDEDGLPFLCAIRAPFEIMLRPQRLAIRSIGAEKAVVEAVAGIGEVVGFAPEGAQSKVGREDEP